MKKALKIIETTFRQSFKLLPIFIGVWIYGPGLVHSSTEQCVQGVPGVQEQLEETSQGECDYRSFNNGKILHIRLGDEEFKLPLGPGGLLKPGPEEAYQYNESNNILLVRSKKGRKIWINVDPTGTHVSKIILDRPFRNKVCKTFSFPYSYEKDVTRLGRSIRLNGGIMYSSAQTGTKDKDQSYIVRSKNLGKSNLINMAEKLENKRLRPIVSSKCLKKFMPEIVKLSCTDPDYQQKVQSLREKIAGTYCGEYLYKDNNSSPLIIHLHASGFGGEVGRGGYALEEIKAAQVFGFRFYHPYHLENPTPITGGDIFRPIFFAKGNKESRTIKLNEGKQVQEMTISASKIFDFDGHDEAVMDLYNRITDPEEREERLAGIMDKFHFYDPTTMEKFLSKEALACFNLTPEIILQRRQDSLKFSGSWKGLLDILGIILDENTSKVFLHCHGGRHKTGIVSLGLRYLDDPHWLYGPRMKLSYGIKTDSHTGEENLSWAAHDEAFLERYKWETSDRSESAFKNFWAFLFKPESGWFNPAETEYISHNAGQVRISNLTSTRDLFRLYYEPTNEQHVSYIKDKYHLDDGQIKEILSSLKDLKEKMEKKKLSFQK